MRIDLTVRDGADERDLAVLAPDGACWADVAALVAPGAAGIGRTHGPLTPPTPLGPGGLVNGEVLTVGDTRAARSPGATHRVTVVGGPDAGTGIALGRAAVTVGRSAACDLVLHDRGVSRVHAEFALTALGPRVRDRGSANGTWLDGRPVDADAAAVADGSYVRVGDTFLAVRTAGWPASRAGAAARAVAGAEITLPSALAPESTPRVQWVAALAPAVVGGALAVALHAPQFLLFAALSPIALLATSFGERRRARRERRRRQRRHRQDLVAARVRVAQALAAETSARRRRDPDPAEVLRAAHLPGPDPWHRARERPLQVRLGLSDLAAATLVRDGAATEPAGTVRAVPVGVDLASGPLGIAGPRPVAIAIASWVVGQLAAHASPGQVEFAFLLSPRAQASWHWARWLPHLDGRVALTRAEQRALLVELTDVRRPERRLVIIVDRYAELDQLPGLTELLSDGAAAGITGVCVDERPAALSGCVHLASVVGDTGSRLQVNQDGAVTSTASPVVADQVSPRWADELARALSPRRDARARAGGAVPDMCRLLPLIGLDRPTADLVLARWRDAGPGLTTILGVAADGPLAVDLTRDGPHALVAGTTGAGKSELLRTLVAGLAATHPPERVTFLLIDYKGGAAFAECAQLPHTVGVLTDLDGHLAARAIGSLDCELTRRERVLADAGARSIEELAGRAAAEPMPRLVIVIDEFAELAADLDDFVPALVGIARRGRSLGLHLVLATQRPGGVVSPEIRANTALRIALRVTDPADSRDVLDEDLAVTIGRRYPGRGYVRPAGTSAVLLQTARVDVRSPQDATPRVVALAPWRRLPLDAAAGGASDLQLLVASARAAAARSGCAPPRRPWLPPLPERLALAQLPRGAPGRIYLGRLDRPREQRQDPYDVELRDRGSLLFAGGPGSGRTSALLTLAVASATELGPDQLHLYAIDWAGGGLASLRVLPHCGSCVGAEPASTARLLARLAAQLDRPRDPGAGAAPHRLVVLDGWEQFVAAADEHDAGRTVDTLLGLLRAGASAGLTVAIAGDRATLAPRLSSAIGTKLVLRLTDRADYALAGLAERAVPTRLPPGRAVRAGDGMQVQLAHLGVDPSVGERDRAIARVLARWPDRPRAGGLIRVRELPSRVHLSQLPRRRDRITLGVGGDDAAPIDIDLFAGAGRLLVAGPPRSGRSSSLLCILGQLLAARRRVLIAAGPHSPLTRAGAAHGGVVVAPDARTFEPPAGAEPTVLLVDDADRYQDTAAGDAVTTWLRNAPPQLAVVAAASTDEAALAFRGILAEVRRARCLLLLHPGPGDGDLAGVRLPRPPTRQPPGRGLLVGEPAWGERFADGPVPIQLAQP